MYTQAQLKAALRSRARDEAHADRLANDALYAARIDADLAAYDAHVAEHGVLCEVTGKYVTPEQAKRNIAAWNGGN